MCLKFCGLVLMISLVSAEVKVVEKTTEIADVEINELNIKYGEQDVSNACNMSFGKTIYGDKKFQVKAKASGGKQSPSLEVNILKDDITIAGAVPSKGKIDYSYSLEGPKWSEDTSGSFQFLTISVLAKDVMTNKQDHRVCKFKIFKNEQNPVRKSASE